MTIRWSLQKKLRFAAFDSSPAPFLVLQPGPRVVSFLRKPRFWWHIFVSTSRQPRHASHARAVAGGRESRAHFLPDLTRRPNWDFPSIPNAVFGKASPRSLCAKRRNFLICRLSLVHLQKTYSLPDLARDLQLEDPN